MLPACNVVVAVVEVADLDVAVDNVPGVEEYERLEELPGDVANGRLVERALELDHQRVERAERAELEEHLPRVVGNGARTHRQSSFQ